MESPAQDRMVVLLPAAWRLAAEWVLRWILGEVLKLDAIYLDQPGGSVEIRLRGKVLSLPCDFFDQNMPAWLQQGSLVAGACPDWQGVRGSLDANLTGNSIPVLWGRDGFTRTAQGDGRLHLDVVGSVFFMLSRYEEMVKPERDQHDRFPGAASMAARRGFAYRPIVDEYIEILWAAMLSIWPQLTRPRAAGETVVTCDVDEPYERYTKTPWLLAQGVGGALLRRRSLSCAIRRMKNAWYCRRGRFEFDPNWNFPWYMSTLEARGLRGHFYFIPTPGNTELDCMYSLTEARMQELLGSMSARGHQIGMHGSYGTFRDGALVARERQSLIGACCSAGAQDAVNGNRQHYLRWDAGQTADHLDNAGFEYDSSGGYADVPGFRYGTARAFPMWSWKKQQALALRQHPLILMENSVISYLKLGYTPEAFDLMRQLKHAALRYGNFTMLWHNSSFSTPEDFTFFTELLAA